MGSTFLSDRENVDTLKWMKANLVYWYSNEDAQGASTAIAGEEGDSRLARLRRRRAELEREDATLSEITRVLAGEPVLARPLARIALRLTQELAELTKKIGEGE